MKEKIPHSYIQSEEARRFMSDHKNADLHVLLLKYAHDPRKKYLVSQLIQRQKLKTKLPQWTEVPGVIFPVGLSTEQSSSEATARLKASLLNAHSILDISGGMGVDSYYFSRKVTEVIYSEKQEDLCAISAHNFKILEAENIKVYCCNSLDLLEKTDYDLIYADPARRDDQKRKLHLLKDYDPDIIPHLEKTIQAGRKWLIKTSPMLDISQAIQELRYVSEIWVISVRNDCKEVVYYLHPSAPQFPIVKTYNIIKNGSAEEFHFSLKDHSNPVFQLPQEFLYEPNASIQKAGGVNKVADIFDLFKLHSNTHLLTGENRENFPGKKFRLIELHKPYAKTLRKKRLNVISRNYPDKASEIEKRLQLKGSDKDYLLAAQLYDGRFAFIEAQLIE